MELIRGSEENGGRGAEREASPARSKVAGSLGGPEEEELRPAAAVSGWEEDAPGPRQSARPTAEQHSNRHHLPRSVLPAKKPKTTE